MLRACLAMLAVLGALFAGYYWWLAPQFDAPGVWIGAGVMALVAGGSLGAIINAGTAYREWSLLSAARHDLPWQDGRWTAVSGTIHPVAEPVIAPFSGEECVLCEYDVASQHRLAESSGNPGSDYTGFLMNPCVVRTNQGDMKLLGFPHLNGFGERTLDTLAAVRNARTFLLGAEFEDYSGLKMMNIVSVIKEAWNDEDGFVRKNVRLTSKPPAALFTSQIDEQLGKLAAAEQAEGRTASASEAVPGEDDEFADADDAGEGDFKDGDEDLDDELDDDLDEEFDDELDSDDGAGPPSVPLLKERRVKIGDKVCAIGIYNGQQRGLVPGGLGADCFVKLVRGGLAGVEGAARTSTFSRLIGGLVGLVLVHAIAYGVMMANRYHPDVAKRRKSDAFRAAANGEVAVLAKLVTRGVGINERNEEDETLLSEAKKPETVQWLIEHQADLNALTNGRTRLMDAARDGDAAIAKLLINAKTDLEVKSTGDGLTAIEYAHRYGRDEVLAQLRAAGAKEGFGEGTEKGP